MTQDNLVLIEERGHAGLITLNRPKALNALNLPMIRDITAALLKWKDSPQIKLVAIRGMGKAADGSFAPFGAFCAGGDIRFFHQAALAGDPALEDFFTEEYSLNHLIHTYPKPYVAFLDGICMGGGMGISGHGGANTVRITTERTKMAMPETMIGLFPDVGGGWFLSRCDGAQPGMGEYLALTGHLLNGAAAVDVGLADVQIASLELAALWDSMGNKEGDVKQILASMTTKSIALRADSMPANSLNRSKISHFFAQGNITSIVAALEADSSDWAKETAALLRKRSPLMLHVTLDLVRRARGMEIADELRLERDLVRHCFHTQHLQRSGAATETVEGIRALAVDKDHAPKWQPARIEDITPEMVAPFFSSPWPANAHLLQHLS
ncbi:MAG: enoyl-CoA hydratase/isomerase family protein [Brachymonas sp.]|nr:enoyl-CoA hydratase/isomerase family protein [Brachymonas sp.]